MQMLCDTPYYALRTLKSQQCRKGISHPSCAASLDHGPLHVSVLAMGSAMPPAHLLPDLDPLSPLSLST